MIEYIKAQKAADEAIINNVFTEDELHRFSKADSRWITNKGKEYRTEKIKKGQIYQFEFGKNFAPEMSYEHIGLIIGVKNKLLYVLPIFSYNPEKYKDIYHPTDFPDSKSDVYLLKKSEFNWIKRDSVLKLNDIRTVSVNRILYRHEGSINPASEIYKGIEVLVLKKYFAEFYYEFENNKKDLELLKEANIKLEEEIKACKLKIFSLESDKK